MHNNISLSAYHPTVAQIDLDAFHGNVNRLKKVAPKSKLMAVVKTNAYGHGVVPISQEAVRAGADRLGVTTVEEGALLRENGIRTHIQILSSIPPRQAEDPVTSDSLPSMSSFPLSNAINKAAMKQKKIISVHLKIHPGLRRFGIHPSVAVQFCTACYYLPGLHWEAIYTHYP